MWTDESGRLQHFSKFLADRPGEPHGEHVGIIKIGAVLRKALLDRAPDQLRKKPAESYETLLIDLLPEHRMVTAYIRDLAWSEIDTAEMLLTARNVIWPRLKALGDV